MRLLNSKTIPGGLDERIRLSGDRTAYIFDDTAYTWDECGHLAAGLAHLLAAKGVKKGSHVGLWGVNSIEWVIHYYAVEMLGAVAVLLNYSYKEEEAQGVLMRTDVEFLALGEPKGELDYPGIMSDIAPKLPCLKEYFLMREAFESVRTLAGSPAGWSDALFAADAPSPGDTALIIFTSGTTSRPKGVMLGHGQLMRAMSSVVDRMCWDEEDRLLLSLPMFHGSGANCGILAGLISGMSSVIMRSYRSEPVMQMIEKYRCTVLNAVPSTLLMMIHHPAFGKYDLSSLKSGTISGSTISEESYLRIADALRIETLLPAYGMTETSTLNTLVERDTVPEQRFESAGTPFEGVGLRIWDCAHSEPAGAFVTGEIQVSGYCVMKGYYHNEEKIGDNFTYDGWFRTGDAGYLDEKGALHFVSRISEMIIRGGENISPVEIENCIAEYSNDVSAVKVVGVETPIIQEEVAALVETASGSIDTEDLRRYIRMRLADYKVPKYIFSVRNLEMTESGKIDRKKACELAKRLAEKDRKGDYKK